MRLSDDHKDLVYDLVVTLWNDWNGKDTLTTKEDTELFDKLAKKILKQVDETVFEILHHYED